MPRAAAAQHGVRARRTCLPARLGASPPPWRCPCGGRPRRGRPPVRRAGRRHGGRPVPAPRAPPGAGESSGIERLLRLAGRDPAAGPPSPAGNLIDWALEAVVTALGASWAGGPRPGRRGRGVAVVLLHRCGGSGGFSGRGRLVAHLSWRSRGQQVQIPVRFPTSKQGPLTLRVKTGQRAFLAFGQSAGEAPGSHLSRRRRLGR